MQYLRRDGFDRIAAFKKVGSAIALICKQAAPQASKSSRQLNFGKHASLSCTACKHTSSGSHWSTVHFSKASADPPHSSYMIIEVHSAATLSGLWP